MIKNLLSQRILASIVMGSGLLFASAAYLTHAEAKSDKQGQQQAAQVDEKTVQRIVERIQRSRAELEVVNVRHSPIPGLYQAQIVNGPLVYVTSDAEYMIAGDLYQLAPGRLVNVSEEGRNDERKEALAQVDKKDLIVFPAKGETKHRITVFTDIDCGYCRMLHQEVPALNEMGVEVRYMAYPRAGLNSESFNKLATAWCADDPQETLTKLKSGESVPTKVCDSNPVAKHYAMGQQLGVTATPALVLESGELQLGYMKAPQLAERLGISR